MGFVLRKGSEYRCLAQGLRDPGTIIWRDVLDLGRLCYAEGSDAGPQFGFIGPGAINAQRGMGNRLLDDGQCLDDPLMTLVTLKAWLTLCGPGPGQADRRQRADFRRWE